MKERETGFYWCNMGKIRGGLSGWCVCWWWTAEKKWYIPYYNEQWDDKDFEEIDELAIKHQPKSLTIPHP